MHYINAELNAIWDKTKEKDFPPMNRHMAYGILVDKLLAELKKCYEEIDLMQGSVPYVEHCEECGATDGGEAEGCDYCGITHYRSKPRGFLHRDSPKW